MAKKNLLAARYKEAHAEKKADERELNSETTGETNLRRDCSGLERAQNEVGGLQPSHSSGFPQASNYVVEGHSQSPWGKSGCDEWFGSIIGRVRSLN